MRAFLVLLVTLVILAAFLLFSGAYNVAAVVPHSDAMRWLLSTARDESIARQSGDIQPPPLTDPELARAGFHEYHEMCFTCHGAPGHEPSVIGRGLNPEPPKLDAPEVQTYSDAELYWIIKNGIRMTGMPAFGPTHDEKALWSLVAFVRSMQKLKPQEYSAMVEAGEQALPHGGHAH